MVKKILVPLWRHGRNIGALHHALALARRIAARVFLLEFTSAVGEPGDEPGSENVTEDLVAAARLSGLNVSCHKADGPFAEEVTGFLEREPVDILVLGEAEEDRGGVLVGNKWSAGAQVILVKKRKQGESASPPNVREEKE